jgi:hypothetical protein
VLPTQVEQALEQLLLGATDVRIRSNGPSSERALRVSTYTVLGSSSLTTDER